MIIACTQKDRGIGLRNKIPWILKLDMEEFKKITSACNEGHKNAVIMGRKTWESIPVKFQPLPNRVNFVLSRNPEFEAKGAIVVASLKNAMITIKENVQIEKIFVIGGSQLYTEALLSAFCTEIYLTQIFKEYQCDVFLPPIDLKRYELSQTSPILNDGDHQIQFLIYKKKHEEYQYLDLAKELIVTGNFKSNRTGIPTFSHFGRSMRFNLRHGTFPLLTTKNVFFRGVVEELLWFIKGQTDSKILSNKRVKIWDDNGSRDFLDKLGFKNREVGDLGPIYSHQWRHFGAQYEDCHTDYTGKGYDQLSEVIKMLKTNPNDRRMIICAWNPTDLSKMALPPCHVMFQFYAFDGELSCSMYQRSADVALGVPFNIASYALLTYMIAQVCGLTPGDFIHFLGDTHVYENHVEPLKIQLQRKPKSFPTIALNREKTNIEDFVFKDFKLINYEPHGKIEMEMAV